MNPESPFPVSRFLAPRFWPGWLGLGLLWLAAQLPRRPRLWAGALFGRLLWWLLPRRRRIATVNLNLCFPALSEAERRRLLRHHFASLGMMLVELAMSWWLSDARLRGLAGIEGIEHFDRALEQGRGVILLSAHLTTMEIGGRLLLLERDFHPMYRESKNPLFETVMHRGRARHADKAIRRGDIRGMLKSLKQNVGVWYAPDQDYGMDKSSFAPFFGVPAATITATSRLAAMSGAPVVPFFQQRLDDGRYRLYFLPALEGFPGEDPVADAARINALIEKQIRQMPEQYLWVHRRFKNRPEGEPGVYR